MAVFKDYAGLKYKRINSSREQNKILFPTTDAISPLAPALSPLRGEGELFADFWQCLETRYGSCVQTAHHELSGW
jgi:hypothetical protein